MAFKTKEEALKYLRNQEKIFLPSQFTYWCHSSSYSTEGKAGKKIWQNLPTEKVVVKGELSLLSRGLRLEYAAEKNNLKEAPISYAPANDATAKAFQLKVVMPKMDMTVQELKNVGKTDEQISRFNREKYGLGDNRHPKLSGNTEIHIFGYMDQDEMTQKSIDTVFGVRDEDLLWYANAVQDEFEKRKQQNKTQIDATHLPKSREDARKEDNIRQSMILGDNGYKEKNAYKEKKGEKQTVSVITKDQILEKISEKLGDDWQVLERNDETLNFKTKKERIDYEYRRSTSPPKFSTDKERQNAWNYVCYDGMSNDRAEGTAFGPLDLLARAYGDSEQQFKAYIDRIKNGTNIEGSIRQAYGFISALESFPQDEETKPFVQGLKDFIANVKNVEVYSPYYELKTLQKKKNAKMSLWNAEKDYNKRKNLEQQMTDIDNEINDFIENCNANGLDSEIAEEYLRDCQVNLQHEKNLENAAKRAATQQNTANKAAPQTSTQARPQGVYSNFGTTQTTAAKTSSEPAASQPSDSNSSSGWATQQQRYAPKVPEPQTNARKVNTEGLVDTFKDIAQDINNMFQGQQQESGPKVEKVSKEEIEEVKKEEPGVFVDEYGVVRRPEHSSNQVKNEQGFERGR